MDNNKNRNPLQTIIITGTLGILIVIGGTAGFLAKQKKLLDRLEQKQACFLDLVDFRGRLVEFELSRKKTFRNSHAFSKQDTRGEKKAASLLFMYDKLLTDMKTTGLQPLPSLTESREGRVVISGLYLENFLSELNKAVEKSESETKKATGELVVINEFFLFFILVILLTLSITAGWQLHRNYRRTLIPLAQLAAQMKLLNRNIPESIHDTAEEIKKELSGTSHSSDITQITESIVEFFTEIEAKNKKLDEVNIRDEKTGLFNYRHFKEHLIIETERTKRQGNKVSLAMIDIDHFKEYNDRNGHLAGDQVLKTLAELISNLCRSSDIPSRFGGEEFAVLFPNTDSGTAREIAVRLRRAIASEPFENEEYQPSGQLTVSIGVATFPGDADDWHALIENADRALYSAKSSGRNGVVTFASIEKAEPTRNET